jgi:protein-S-isoprenylcysteine O-methyltransferase Ste14
VSRAKAALGSAVFLVIAPGVVAGVIPWWLTGWNTAHELWLPLRLAGAAVIVAGAGVLLHAFASFVLEGVGTPAPVAPTERLVVGGLYRYVRNPMYLAVVATILGQAAVLGRLNLVVYAAAIWLLFAAFVHWYEEPHLTREYGERYERYRKAVPGWLPRRK